MYIFMKRLVFKTFQVEDAIVDFNKTRAPQGAPFRKEIASMRTTTQPIKDEKELERFKDYYKHINPNIRNYTLVVISLNTALRISDILMRKWSDFYKADDTLREHLEIIEKKTGKTNIIAINSSIAGILETYRQQMFGKCPVAKDEYLFPGKNGNMPLSRIQAYRIIKTAAIDCGLNSHISCHSLRKTFGYHAWKQGVPPALLMDIYNHSSYKVTRRYLCIDQVDKDNVFYSIVL